MSRRKHVMEFIDWLEQQAQVGLLDPPIVAGVRSLAAVYCDPEAKRFADRAGYTR